MSTHGQSVRCQLCLKVCFAQDYEKFLAIQNFVSRTAYAGISIFLRCVHVECQFQALNRLPQNAEFRSVRAHPCATPPYEHQCARSHRSSGNWWRNRPFIELKNRYLLCRKECFFISYKIKSRNGGITRGRRDRATASEAEWSVVSEERDLCQVCLS